MGMRRLIAALVVLTLLAFGGVASAGFIYTVTNGPTSQIVDPLAKAETAALYYDYPFEAASGRPDFGTVEDTAFFWLYTDSNTGVLSLGMVFDKRNASPSPSDTGGTMNLTTSGMPGTAFVSVSDDGPETGTLINGTETWGWNHFNTDGGMVSGLENSTWSIDIDINSFSGLDGGFNFLNGPSSSSPSLISLDPGQTLTITATATPEPTTVALLSLGLVALGVARRRGQFRR